MSPGVGRPVAPGEGRWGATSRGTGGRSRPGGAAVLSGLLAMALPGATLAALVILFGAYALVDGAFALVTAAQAVGRHAAWLGSLVEGVLGVAAGVATL